MLSPEAHRPAHATGTKQYNDLALKVRNACCGSQRFSACRRSKAFTPPATCSRSCAAVFANFFYRCQRTLAQQTSGTTDFHGRNHIKTLTDFVAKCQATQLAKKPVAGQKSTYTSTQLYFSSAAQASATVRAPPHTPPRILLTLND